MTFGDESFYALSAVAEALRDIAKQTRYTYLQGNGSASTLRIDNQTGKICKLTSQWNNHDGNTTLVWEPELVVERQADAQEAEPSPPAEPEANGALRVSHDPGDDFPYGVEYFHYGQWCPVMSPYDADSDLRFMSQGQAEQWIAERQELPF